METHLADFIRGTGAGTEAEAILRNCVHCGFCTATCPTYQLFGDELDGPRGRIYLIKQVLEGKTPTEKTRLHLDRCLTCRSCETTCPSGVHYSRLLDIGRATVERMVPRRGIDALRRMLLKTVLPRRRLFAFALALGRLFRPLLPSGLRTAIPPARAALTLPRRAQARKMIVLGGCVQPALSPNINAAAAQVLDRLGIELVEAARAGCCGALRFHLNDAEAARQDARDNIDAWWPMVEAGAEAILSTASGCGVHLRDYGHLLQDDPAYAPKARRIAELSKDIGEVLAAESERLKPLLAPTAPCGERIAFHAPCTLQHGMKLGRTVEALLRDAGYVLSPVSEGHLCCGSAGTYSILQPDIAHELRARKLAALQGGGPARILSANIGCICHLQAGTDLPVRHWVEALAERLQ